MLKLKPFIRRAACITVIGWVALSLAPAAHASGRDSVGFAPAAPASPSARTASATNAETSCPFWSKLETDGTLAGKSPQAIAISRKMVGSAGSSAEWEVSGRSTQAGIALYSGVVEVMVNDPRFGLEIVRLVWMHGHGRELVARFTPEAGKVFRAVVCGHHPHLLPPGRPYTGRGSSCKKPLRSITAQDFEHYGDGQGRRHMPIALEPRNPPKVVTADVTVGTPVQPLIPQMHPEPPAYYEVTITSDTQVVICKAFIETDDSNTGAGGRHRLSVGPHGLEPFTIADYAPWDFIVIVEGRYAKGGHEG